MEIVKYFEYLSNKLSWYFTSIISGLSAKMMIIIISVSYKIWHAPIIHFYKIIG